MAHYEDDRPAAAPAAPLGMASRIAAAAVGLPLIAASGVSLVYLSQRWQDAAPYREARAIEAADRRAVADAARAAEQADEERLEQRRANAARNAASSPSGVQTGDVMVTAPPRPGGAVAGPNRSAPSRPVRWLSQPRFRIPPDVLVKPGPDRISIHFECRVNREGGLYGCTGTETPRGFGMLTAARAALSEARVEPMTDNGRPVEGVVTFDHSWTRSRAISAPAIPAPAAGPAAADSPALVTPAPEPAAAQGKSPPVSDEPPPVEG